MHEYLKQFVSTDTIESWSIVKSQMPWRASADTAHDFADLKFEEIDVDISNPEEIAKVLATSAKGTIWGEFYVDGGITLGDNFYPYIQNCQQLAVLEKVPSLSNLSGLLKSNLPWREGMPSGAISYLVISCPRCHIIFTDGDAETISDPEEEEGWIQEDCPACTGTGEWVYSLN